MRITLKEHEVKNALLAYAASMGVATTDSDVVFTKGRKGNGLTAEILIGEKAEPVEETEVAEEADVAEEVAAPVTESAASTEDAFA